MRTDTRPGHGPSRPRWHVPGLLGAALARPATGALFDGPAEDPGDHFCSASVVESTTGDLVVTAAHCVADGDADADADATTVSGTAGTLDEDQWQLDRPGLDQGSSGGLWPTGPDDSEILAVTGGYQQGGDSPDVSHGADLGPAVQSAYRSAGGTD